MANKRQKKKKATQHKYSLLERKGYTKKEVKRNKQEIEKVYKQELAKEKKRQAQQKLRREKKRFILENDLDNVSIISIWTKKPVAKKPTENSSWENLRKLQRKKAEDKRYQARIIKLISVGYSPDEIKKSWVLSDKSTQGYLDKKSTGINWNKVYHVDNAIFFSFRDISQNCDLAGIIRNYLSMSIESLLKELQNIVNKPCSYSPELHAGSSGKAGQAHIEYGTEDYVDKLHKFREVQARTRHTDRINRMKKKRKYKSSNYNTYIPFQKLNGGHIHKTTLKNLVAIITSILNNVFEEDRRELYNSWYDIVVDIEPKIIDYIPESY